VKGKKHLSSRSNPSEELHPNATELFVYRPVGLGTVGSESNGNKAEGDVSAMQNDIARREREAWQKGFAEGQARSVAESDKTVKELRASVAQSIQDFLRDRDAYFARVEEEVVHLALAISRKILNREAQIDPLLLTGLVHVALDKLGDETKTRLRAHPSQIGSWREHFQALTNGKVVPEIVADDTLATTQCVLETELGATEVSLNGQLKEIEQGFFDLLAHRPRPE
jgi:flagellar assembly protein FliH